MSKLTETVCIKVSKEVKDFLDDLDNSSDFIRSLIRQSMMMNEDLSEHFEIVTRDGEDFYTFDEDRLEDTLTKISKETFLNAMDLFIKRNK